MSSDDFENLPIVLISSVDIKTADSAISELIDNEETESEVRDAGAGRVWRLANKYYTARVRLLVTPDAGAGATVALAPEAHVIYLTESECACGTTAAALLERRAGAGAAAGGVRLALGECAAEPPALAAAAARRRYELVPLREPAPAPAPAAGEPFPELCGWERARAALHAHAWPGLRRAPPAAGGGHGAQDEEAAAVERAEAFAEALSALAEARAQPAPARRARAEALLGAFARALGLQDELDLDEL